MQAIDVTNNKEKTDRQAETANDFCLTQTKDIRANDCVRMRCCVDRWLSAADLLRHQLWIDCGSNNLQHSPQLIELDVRAVSFEVE